MILLDKPLVSDFLKQTIRDGQIEALDTGGVIIPPEKMLLKEEDAIQKFREDPSINLHTTSENALKWIYDKLPFSGLPEKINLFKNKLAFRDLIREMYPDFFYMPADSSKLEAIDIGNLPKPFIIKPAIGFFSMGVHKVFDEHSWTEVKEKITAELNNIRSVYPTEVLSLDQYIIEECIEGKEFAFDAYYDDEGKAVLMGIMHHPFSGENDVSDRVYNTSRDIVEQNRRSFTKFLAGIGSRAGLKNFSLHVEVRVDATGKVTPIEVNPLRFGAWCTSADLAHYAFDFNPYTCYITKQNPDWDSILRQSDGKIYSIIILENSTGIGGEHIKGFDYGKINPALGNVEVLEMRKINYREYPIFAILFTRSDKESYRFVEQMLHADMKNFITLH